MSVLTPTAAKGQTVYEAGGPQRTHDDVADNKVGGSYSHIPSRASATEADEWNSWMLFVQSLLASNTAIKIRNATGGTLARGSLLRVSGYNAANSAFLVTKADADDQYGAQIVIAADLADSTNGLGYGSLSVTGTSGEPVDTSGRTVGDIVYLSGTAGGWSATLPTADGSVQQIVGVVKVVSATVGVIAFVPGQRLMLRQVVMTGDSGSGGKRGLVPAPASGDAAANKYLKADGTWATVNVALPSQAAYSTNWTTVNNSTTLVDVNDLEVQLPSTGQYIVRAHLILNTTDPEGLKVTLDGPTASGCNLTVMYGGFGNVTVKGTYIGSLGSAASYTLSGGGYVTVDIFGGINVTDATDPLVIQIAQDTAGMFDLIAYDNGYLEVIKVG